MLTTTSALQSQRAWSENDPRTNWTIRPSRSRASENSGGSRTNPSPRTATRNSTPRSASAYSAEKNASGPLSYSQRWFQAMSSGSEPGAGASLQASNAASESPNGNTSLRARSGSTVASSV